VIILSIGDDKTQEYISGIEGSEGITAMALSHSKNFLAVCERSEKAICSIYNTKTLKRKKVITTDHITDKEFISVAFSHQNEKGHLVTLTGGQDGMIILWQWNKGKCIAYQKVGISEGQTLYQASFNNLDFNSLIVTGNGVYKYYKLKDNGLRPEHSALAKKESHISNHYTCHTWLPEGKIIICTDQGELLLLESTGEYKMCLDCSPKDGFYIEAIAIYSKGFMIAGDTGQIKIYEKTDEPKKPFQEVATWPNVNDPKEEKKYPNLLLSIMASRIKCLALSSNDDTLVFSTENNQLMKVNLNQEKKLNESVAKYEYLIYPFHSRAISGLDVCIKKNLVATCSYDKTVRIWSYSPQNFKLDICESFQEEALSVAFHPSGYHIVVGFTDKIRMMNVFSEKKLSTFKEIPIKSCREIQFSNGGHLFACVNVYTIQIYNFYTGENLSSMIFNEHEGKVRCISWAEDDSYFVSAGWDGRIYVWNIKNNSKPEYYFDSKGTNFSCVAKAPGMNSVFAVGTDKTVREISYKMKEEKNETSVSAMIATEKETKYPLETKEKTRYESYINYSQICLLNNGRGVIVGTADDDRPGMIQVFRLDMDVVADIQAHSLPVERMKLSFDNMTLFTAGQDGTFFMFDLKDSEYKSQKEAPQIQYSEEILCEKAELRELLQDIEHLKRECDQLTQHKDMEQKRLEAENNEKIAKLKEDRDNNKRIAKEKHDQLAQEITDLERRYKEQILKKNDENEEELKRRMRDFEEKKQQDRIRYQEQELLMKEEEEKVRLLSYTH
jgi:cilia- and flagella-associated protein 57